MCPRGACHLWPSTNVGAVLTKSNFGPVNCGVCSSEANGNFQDIPKSSLVFVFSA